jgi:hypothetical protein
MLYAEDVGGPGQAPTADFLNVCSANILVLTGLQHQYIGAVQGEPNCLQHHAYSVKRCLFNLLE